MRKSISMPELYQSQIVPYRTEPISIPPKKKNTLSTKALSYDNVSIASAYTSYHNAFLCSTIMVGDDNKKNKDIDFAFCIATPPDIVDEHKDSEICSEEILYEKIKENARQHLRKMSRRKKKNKYLLI